MDTKIKFSSALVEALFKKDLSLTEIIIELHKMVISDFDQREKLEGYVKVSKDTWKDICRRCMAKVPENGGLIWMNYGFSAEEGMPDWVADISEAIGVKNA